MASEANAVWGYRTMYRCPRCHTVFDSEGGYAAHTWKYDEDREERSEALVGKLLIHRPWGAVAHVRGFDPCTGDLDCRLLSITDEGDGVLIRSTDRRVEPSRMFLEATPDACRRFVRETAIEKAEGFFSHLPKVEKAREDLPVEPKPGAPEPTVFKLERYWCYECGAWFPDWESAVEHCSRCDMDAWKALHGRMVRIGHSSETEVFGLVTSDDSYRCDVIGFIDSGAERDGRLVSYSLDSYEWTVDFDRLVPVEEEDGVKKRFVDRFVGNAQRMVEELLSEAEVRE